MKRLLIIYHSQSGSTERLALAALDGARRDGDAEARLVRAVDAGLDDLVACDALLFGTPENLGHLSGAMKDFFDRTFYPAAPYTLNLPYAVFVSAGNDGTNAVRELERIAVGYPLRKVADSVIIRGEVDAAGCERVAQLGQTLAAGLGLGIF